MFRPKIPEVLAAGREAGVIYEKGLRALDELPGQIARAEHALRQRREGAQCLRRPGFLQLDVDEPLSGDD